MKDWRGCLLIVCESPEAELLPHSDELFRQTVFCTQLFVKDNLLVRL